jgi:hypothetical protein
MQRHHPRPQRLQQQQAPPPPDVAAVAVVSDFDLSRMPDRIHGRTLQAWSVHRSCTTGNCIATIPKVVPALLQQQQQSFKSAGAAAAIGSRFPQEREARQFCKGPCAPTPKLPLPAARCALCVCGDRRRRRHRHPHHLCCRSGRSRNSKTAAAGEYCPQQAGALSEKGRAQLGFLRHLSPPTKHNHTHTQPLGPPSIVQSWAGGSLDLVRWLVDAHCVPIFGGRLGSTSSRCSHRRLARSWTWP